MRLIGKYVAKKLAGLIVIGLLLIGGFFWVKSLFPNWFSGAVTARYEFVIKRFEQESQLVVAGAEVETRVSQTFTNDHLKDWPEWTQTLTRLFVGRDLVVEIPVETEFKLQLEGLTKQDVSIEGNRLRFKKPLVVYVDSQTVGVPVIQKTSNGLIDKAVDVFTAGKKASEFMNEQSQAALHETSEEVMADQGHQEKVAKFASQALENLLNLSSEEGLEVDLTVEDLEFVNIDKPN